MFILYKIKIVQYIFFTVNVHFYNFFILSYKKVSLLLIVFFKKRPTLGLYSKAFMNYNNLNLNSCQYFAWFCSIIIFLFYES